MKKRSSKALEVQTQKSSKPVSLGSKSFKDAARAAAVKAHAAKTPFRPKRVRPTKAQMIEAAEERERVRVEARLKAEFPDVKVWHDV